MICSKCKQEKEENMFPKVGHVCKRCKADYLNEYLKRNKDKRKKYRKAVTQKIGSQRKRIKAWTKKHPERAKMIKALNRWVRMGKIPALKCCTICGKQNTKYVVATGRTYYGTCYEHFWPVINWARVQFAEIWDDPGEPEWDQLEDGELQAKHDAIRAAITGELPW